MSNHTPGPWIYRGEVTLVVREKRVDGWQSSRGAVVAYVPSASEDSDANAQLIAAAPDLLAALEQVVDVLEGMHDCGACWACDDVLPQARAAIARAKGQQE